MAEGWNSLLYTDKLKPEIKRYIKRATCFLNLESKDEDSDEQIKETSDAQDSDIEITNGVKWNLEDYMLKEVSEDAVFKDMELETDESNESISLSMMIDIVTACLVKLACELQDISNAMIHDNSKRYNAICKELSMDTEQNNNIDKPEIKELISKGVDPMKIGKYMTTVMRDCIAAEVKRCSLMTKSEPNNEGDEKIIPLSRLGHCIIIMLTKFCSEFIVSITDIHEIQKNKYNALYEELNDTIEKRKNIIKENEDRFKQIAIIKEEAKINKNYDVLTKIDSMKIMKISENGKAYKVNASDKNKTSILCRYTSRSKRLEIISTRKQLKGKSGNPSHGSAL